ncbi:hypothetical protein M758_1G235300 [Ceratodon purpureus]|nr:hypothetical protein M758_1G235300 [Ceratodon purpureus]
MASAACVASKVTAVSQLASTSSASTPSGSSRVSVSAFGQQLTRSSCGQQNSSIYGEASVVLRTCARKQGLRRRNGSQNAVVTMSAGTDTAIPSLNELPLVNYINQQGRIQPPVEPSTAASVFAICDSNKKVQYVGFSKDVRNSLRLLMGRRPDLCHFYKLYNLKELDQKQMLACRQSWFSELGLTPPGNTDPVQRALWEQPGDAGSISERGRAAAAMSKAKVNLQMMVDRGLKEEMVYDPQLLEAGKCDVLSSEDQSSEELEQAEKTLAEAAARRRLCTVPIPKGGEIVFELCVEDKWKTNGGWIFDILVSKDDKETVHRVVVGKIYPDAVSMNEDDFLEKVMGFLLHKRIPRHTEGLLTGDMFPINYFSVSEVSQQFTDFQDWFTDELPDSYWRFNKIHSYGAAIDEPPLLGPAFSGYTEAQ